MIDFSELPAYIKIGFENCDINEDTLKNSTYWKEIKTKQKKSPYSDSCSKPTKFTQTAID